MLRIAPFLRTKVEGKDLSLGTGDRQGLAQKKTRARTATRILLSRLEVSDLGLFEQPADPNQNHRSNERDDDRSDQSAARPDAQHAKQPAALKPAKDPQDDVYQNSVAATLHYLPSQPSGDEPND